MKVASVGVFLSVCVLTAYGRQATEVVPTTNGPVRGLIGETRFKKVYSSFKGIRYAAPPVGELRFKSPIEPEPWTDVYDAFEDGSGCPQFDFVYENYSGNEDCLFLNVYVPKTTFNDTGLLPVAVFIYGGSFLQGYNKQYLYGPDYFLEDDVILVIPNYRLGPLGFLSSQSCEAPGNAGIKDQHKALVWVQRNIENFGGNPGNVMLFGQSAGGVGVDVHVLSDKAKGLFHKTSTLSATTLAPWAMHTPEVALKRVFQLGRMLGHVSIDRDDVVKFLRTVDARDLVQATKDIGGILPFRVTLESLPEDCQDEAYITKCPIKQYEAGEYTKLPHMMGYAKYESLNFAKPVATLLEIEEMALSSLDNPAAAFPPLQKAWERLEYSKLKASVDTAYALINYTSDIAFVSEIDLKQKIITKSNGHPIYYYILTYDWERSMHKFFGVNLPGATHGDDCGYLFYPAVANLPKDPNHPVYKFSKKMVRLWTNFCKYSNPTPDGDRDDFLKVTWPDSRASGQQLEINEELAVKDRQISDDASFFQIIVTPAIRVYTGCYSIWNRLPDFVRELPQRLIENLKS